VLCDSYDWGVGGPVGQEVEVQARDGSFKAYLSRPAAGGGAGVVVLQEILGVTSWGRSIVDMLATAGYYALAPDLFWRMTPGVQLDATKPWEFAAALDYNRRLDFNSALDDIRASISFLRGMPGANGKVGNVGFCLGGTLSYLTAANTDSDASVSYYGSGVLGTLYQMPNIKRPAILHLAGADEYIPKEAQDRIAAAAKANSNVTVYVYPNAYHGFGCSDYERHNAAAWQLSLQRTLALFKQQLA